MVTILLILLFLSVDMGMKSYAKIQRYFLRLFRLGHLSLGFYLVTTLPNI